MQRQKIEPKLREEPGVKRCSRLARGDEHREARFLGHMQIDYSNYTPPEMSADNCYRESSRVTYIIRAHPFRSLL